MILTLYAQCLDYQHIGSECNVRWWSSWFDYVSPLKLQMKLITMVTVLLGGGIPGVGEGFPLTVWLKLHLSSVLGLHISFPTCGIPIFSYFLGVTMFSVCL